MYTDTDTDTDTDTQTQTHTHTRARARALTHSHAPPPPPPPPQGKSIGWPDLWGAACRRNKWPVAKNNPEGVMLAGQSGWYDHVQWPVLGLQFRPQWEYSVELTSSILALNKQSPLAVAAWKMAMWMTERPFWGKVLYGDKDTIRLSLLLFGACVTFPPLSPLSPPPLTASRSPPLPTPHFS
jgi:hypothetical protein